MRRNFHLGFDYYPEHWEEEMWKEDLRLMRECGTTCVRIAEFAWTRMEPREGQFTFDWLDRFFALAAENGISIILGTPTAAPPPWAVQAYPDIVMLEESGQRAATTARRYNCPTSPNYLRLCDAIIAQMAKRYGDHPALIGWQTDNEWSGQTCYCEHCRAACREWLKAKYGTVEEMNKKQGLVFWAHEVTNWGQVDLPRSGVGQKKANPSVRLDVARFVSDAWVSFAARQTQLIHKLAPGPWVTHNLPGTSIHIDLWDLAAAHDFISNDLYPKAMIDPPVRVAMGNDIPRSCQGRPHWIMELQSGTPCTKFYKAPVPREGQLRLWAHQCAAHGAEGVVFFRWRKSPAGAEMFGNGLLDHDARPRRHYREVQRLGKDFAALSERLPAYDAPKEVAIVFDFADRINAETHETAMDVDYFGNLARWYQAARALGLNVRFVRSRDGLKAWPLVIAPSQYVTSPEIVENFSDYVQGGGTLVGALRMGCFDVHGKPSRQTLPGGMTGLFGAEVEEYERVMEPNPNRLVFAPEIGGPAADCRDWNYILTSLGARPLATYEKDYYAGRMAVSQNDLGKGRAIYVGAILDREPLSRLMRYLASLAGLETLPSEWPGDVEVVRLADADGRPIRVLLNHAHAPKRVALEKPAKDLLDGKIARDIELPALGVRWVEG